MGEARLKQLEDQKAKLEARIAKETAKLKAKQRKADTRRKIIIGALALHNLKDHKDQPASRAFADLIDKTTTRSADRAILGLPEQPGTASPDQIIDALVQSLKV